MKRLFLILASLLFSLPLFAANDVYLAQSSAGGNTGVDCADAKPSTYFNSSGNWSATPSGIQIGPATTVHLCGTFSGSGNDQWLAFQGDGSSGNPVTVKFETNAIMTSPHHASAGAIAVQGHVWFVIDGGTNGTIQNTLSGSTGGSCPGGPCSSQADSRGITFCGCNNSTTDTHGEVKNLNILNIYVHTYLGNDPDTYSRIGLSAIFMSGGDVHIHNNKLWNAAEALSFETYGSVDNIEVDHNDLGYDGWGFGVAGDTSVVPNIYFHDNHLHDFGNWQSDNGSTHINGIFAYNGSGGSVNNFYLYNNLFDGDMGFQSWTTWVHFGADAGPPWTTGPGLKMWNNIIVSTQCISNGLVQMEGGSANQIVNNVIIQNSCVNSGSNTNGVGLSAGTAVATTINLDQNNIFSGTNQPIRYGTHITTSNEDYNAFGNVGANGNGNFSCSGCGTGTNSLAAWQAVCSCEAHAQATSPYSTPFSNLTTQGVPSTGFLGIGLGVNLSSSATGPLASLASATTAGNTVAAIPRLVPWAIGAYVLSGGGGIPPTPTPITILTQSLPGATVGVPWTAPPLSASGGTAPYKWSGINFPQGLSITAAGVWNPWVPATTLTPTTYQLGITVVDSGTPVQSKFTPLPLVVSPATTPPPTSGGPVGYTFVANENANFTLLASTSVAFGATGKFNYKTLAAGSWQCSTGLFGDPLFGTVKSCYAQTTTPPPPLVITANPCTISPNRKTVTCTFEASAALPANVPYSDSIMIASSSATTSGTLK